MKCLFLILLSAISLSAAPRPTVGYLLGIEGGGSNQAQVDLGFAMGHEGYTLYGAHVGFLGQTTSPTEQDRDWKKISGSQIGFLFDVGRAFWIAGMETVTTESKATTYLANGAFYTRMNVKDTVNGPYAKVGYKFGNVALYGSFGEYTKAMAGAGVSYRF